MRTALATGNTVVNVLRVESVGYGSRDFGGEARGCSSPPTECGREISAIILRPRLELGNL